METPELTHRWRVLCSTNKRCQNVFLQKQVVESSGQTEFLDLLAKTFVEEEECTVDIATCFSPILQDLFQRAKEQASCADCSQSFLQYQKLCIALSRILFISTDVVMITAEYVKDKAAFYIPEVKDTGEPLMKKQKTSSSLMLIEALYRMTQHSKILEVIRIIWDWSVLFEFMENSTMQVKWCALHCICNLLSLSPEQRSAFRNKHFSSGRQTEFVLRFEVSQPRVSSFIPKGQINEGNFQKNDEGDQTNSTFLKETIIHKNLASISGVILPRVPGSGDSTKGVPLVPVPTTIQNLQRLARAVSSECPVLLGGPVGSGKTSLVCHLAEEVGRRESPSFTKIQLGDQTDSKVLLGTYRCTDIPGEFVWQAGILTRAVLEGHWLLLEDLDHAPMDVVSILLPLLQARILCVPGHGDQISAAPGFRLFATQRLSSSGSGLNQSKGIISESMRDLWTNIVIDPLSRKELEMIILMKFPKLGSFVEKMLDIFFLLSDGNPCWVRGVNAAVKTPSLDLKLLGAIKACRRNISVRDLLKWCARIAPKFESADPSTANEVFHEAVDCFCGSVKGKHRLTLAEEIGAKLNFSNQKVEHLIMQKKPLVQTKDSILNIGRSELCIKPESTERTNKQRFAFTRQSLDMLEKIAVCVQQAEPVLLVGETGTGKTTTVQYLAEMTGHRLKVVNLNQQTDSIDLLGGYKPLDIRLLAAPVQEQFEALFKETFSKKLNNAFLSYVQDSFLKQKWHTFLGLIHHSCLSAQEKSKENSDLCQRWIKLENQVNRLQKCARDAEAAFAFSFVDGSLVNAVRSGEWLLLDEINLASADTIECLTCLLEGSSDSLILLEKGDITPVERHPDFRLFACMNPSTDAGKKELPVGIRNRFSEFYVDDVMDTSDLEKLVSYYLTSAAVSPSKISGIVEFYETILSESDSVLSDGIGRRPHYSLRTLCRALEHATKSSFGNIERSLYEKRPTERGVNRRCCEQLRDYKLISY